jgi:hypothetical protein
MLHLKKNVYSKENHPVFKRMQNHLNGMGLIIQLEAKTGLPLKGLKMDNGFQRILIFERSVS